MSATFTVTTQVTQLYQGNVSNITIVNNGPNTIYLGSDTSVDSLNGFALPPTGQMTWNGASSLFACTALGSSSVLTDTSGDLSITTRASYYQKLCPDIIGNGPQVVETGFLNTILLVLTGANENGLTSSDVPSATLEWMDANLNVIYTENVSWNNFNVLTNVVNVQVPVKGSFCRVTLIRWAGLVLPNCYLSWAIFGTDKILPARSWDANQAADDALGVATYTMNNDTVFGKGINQATLNGGILLPSLGTHIWIEFHAGITGAGSAALTDRLTGCEFGFISYVVASSPRQMADFSVSPGSALMFASTTSPPTVNSGTYTWHFTND